MNKTIFLVTGNKFPVTGRTKNTFCRMKNISWCRRYTSCDRLSRLYSCYWNSDGIGETHQSLINLKVSTMQWGLSFYLMVLKDSRVWFLSPNVQTGQGQSVNWSLDCVFLTSLVIGYNFTLIIIWMMMQFFPLFNGNFIPPCQQPTRAIR